jgi:hypothetical protein
MSDNVHPFPTRESEPPVQMWCAGCGKDRTTHSTAGDYGPCECGSTIRTSLKGTTASVSYKQP